MGLAEKIMDLRKRSGWSQEELAGRLGISRQSVSKWETGESVPDLDKIIRMSDLWDVSTDYLLKEGAGLQKESRETADRADAQSGFPKNESWEHSADRGSEVEEQARADGSEPENGEEYTDSGTREGTRNYAGSGPEDGHWQGGYGSAGTSAFGAQASGAGWSGSSACQYREVSRAEALDFLAVSQYASPRIALGVMLCILSPVCLILLSAFSEEPSILKGQFSVSENFAGGIGVSILLVLVAVAVEIFITTGMKLSPYGYIEEELIWVPEDVLRGVEEARADYEHTFRTSIVTGVLLCIIGVIPLFLSIAFFDRDFETIVGVCMLLVFVAAGVFFLVSAGIIHGSHEKLLQTGDFAPEKKRANKRMGAVAGVYWCVIVSVYMFMSFTTMSWERTWIIFPVAGVLFGGISALVHAVSR